MSKSKDLKIAVLNYSGNVGKTTIVNNLLEPRLLDTPIIAVETINDDGTDQIKIKGKDYGMLQDEMLINDRLIVDIGASNIEETMRLMKQYKGSHEDFDYFLIPTVPDGKQQVDTASTIKALKKMGVPSEKIKIVFNKVDEDIEKEFDVIIEIAKAAKLSIPTVGIEYSAVYQELRDSGKTMAELLAMTDLRKQIKATKDPAERISLAALIGTQRLADSAQENLDAVFKDLCL
tara:strand:- start:214 stop:912 length:699 start_codon:yes stop_codon:yes gene_type:complete